MINLISRDASASRVLGLKACAATTQFWCQFEAPDGAEMPKGGRKGGHKGGVRQNTSPEEIDAQLQAEKQKANQEDEQEEGGDEASGDPKKEKKSLDSDESEDEDDDYQQKRKGVEGLTPTGWHIRLRRSCNWIWTGQRNFQRENEKK